MPLPNPQPKESQAEFMNRCMEDPKMCQEYPMKDQRLAVCYMQWKKR